MKFILLCVVLVLCANILNAQSFEKIKNLAVQGDPLAQFELGSMYKKGVGIRLDKQEAFYWFRKSAEQGNPYAQINLGAMYYKGEGTPKDRKKAFYWFKRAPKVMVSSSEWMAISFLKFALWVKEG